MSHRELGAKILKRLTEELADLGDVEVAPKMEGYQMFTILSPKKSKTPATKHTSVAPDKEDEPVKVKKAEKKPAAKPEAAPKKDEDEIF
jgi:hypothetical protein